MSLVKICGLKREQDILAVNAVLPDFIGFVFAKSPRRVDFDTAKALKAMLDKRIKAVGVFVNEEAAAVATLSNSGVINAVQLHGDEDEEYIKRLKALTEKPVIKAVRVRGVKDIARAQTYPCDYLLFDAYSKDARGGTGERFDREALGSLEVIKPYFLAGGVGLENIKDALKLKPYCIDISSGAETGGLKDFEKIKRLVEMVRLCK
jgi:phosphoribosylanthranilate isomerase